ncbi:hypothetical protein WMY93_032803 [Mugilogobius chulae]|uniref:Uncharacterized protein n=1 Tax=Mugilogobius chulae TaxID=88201 RepID=A0AAW0MUM0_9GOBI
MREDSVRNGENETPRVLVCCGGLNNVDYSQMDLAPMRGLLKLIDFAEPTFVWLSLPSSSILSSGMS